MRWSHRVHDLCKGREGLISFFLSFMGQTGNTYCPHNLLGRVSCEDVRLDGVETFKDLVAGGTLGGFC